MIPLLLLFLFTIPAVSAASIAVSPPSLTFHQGAPEDIFLQNPEPHSVNFTVHSQYTTAFPFSGTLQPYETKTIRLTPIKPIDERIRVVISSEQEELSITLLTTSLTLRPSLLIGILIAMGIPLFGFLVSFFIKKRFF